MLYVYIMDDHNKYSCPQNGIIRGQNVEKGYTLMLISKSKLSSFTVQIQLTLCGQNVRIRTV